MKTILEHGWKEKSVKLPNLNVMFLKSNQDVVLQRHRILKMFVWWGGSKNVPLTLRMSKKFGDLVE